MKNKKVIIGAISSVIAVTLIVVLSIVLINVNTKYTVTFKTNGGTNIAAVEVKKGNTIDKPTNPEKENYAFAEWQLSGETFDFNTSIYNDITLDAVWNNFYTVKFDTMDGSKIESQKVENGKLLADVETPIKTNFTFHSWELNGETFDLTSPITNDITLEAVYDYNVTNINAFINMFSQSAVQANILINGKSASLDYYKMLQGDYKNGEFITFGSNGETMTDEVVITNSSYRNVQNTKESRLPLYLLGFSSDDFNNSNGEYSYGGIVVTYLKTNQFRIVYNEIVYEITLQRVDTLESEIYNYGITKYFLLNDEAIIIKVSPTLSTYELLEELTYNDKVFKITQIGEEAFSNIKLVGSSKVQFTKVVLSANLTKIGKSAFEYCIYLSEVNIKSCKSLEVIDANAFTGCSSLLEFEVPITVKEIGDFAFMGITGIVFYIRPLEKDLILGSNWHGTQHNGTNYGWTGQ